MNTKEFIWPEGEEIIYVRPPKEEYNGKLDYFYSPELFPEIQSLKDNWKIIRDEIIDYEKRFGDLSGSNSLNAAKVKGGKWTLIYLKSFKREFNENKASFPKTAKVIDSIPNIVFSAISKLPGNTHILPHYGDTNGIVRGHLALIVPASPPLLTLKVGDEEKGWEEGELLCFVNVQKHEVWNHTDQNRYVIMFDFVPKILEHRTLEICSKGLGSQTYNLFYNKFKFYRLFPEKFHQMNIWVFTQIWKMYLLLKSNRKFKN